MTLSRYLTALLRGRPAGTREYCEQISSGLLGGRPVVLNWWCEGMRLTTCIAHKNVSKQCPVKAVRNIGPHSVLLPRGFRVLGGLGFGVQGSSSPFHNFTISPFHRFTIDFPPYGMAAPPFHHFTISPHSIHLATSPFYHLMSPWSGPLTIGPNHCQTSW